jgi:hypothetical protein
MGEPDSMGRPSAKWECIDPAPGTLPTMKILLGLIATLSVALVPAPAETAKERAHEKVVAEAPPTDSSEQLAGQQIDKSYSSLKAALAGMIESRKKGNLNAFALYKYHHPDASAPNRQTPFGRSSQGFIETKSKNFL